MTKAAEAYVATFVAAGLPNDFGARPRQAANEILRIIDQRAQGMARMSAATEWRSLMRQGRLRRVLAEEGVAG